MVRVVAQRVKSASVTVSGRTVGQIDGGLVLLVGFAQEDVELAVQRIADKIAAIRIFADEQGKMNLSAAEVGAKMLVVSQFTLYADTRKGRRPSFVRAAPPEHAYALYQMFCARLSGHGCAVERGEFGADMMVRLENDGPVTIIFDSAEA